MVPVRWRRQTDSDLPGIPRNGGSGPEPEFPGVRPPHHPAGGVRSFSALSGAALGREGDLVLRPGRHAADCAGSARR